MTEFIAARGQTLVNGARIMSICPQTELSSAKAIRQALMRNLGGHNYGVYCFVSDEKYRVYNVRSRKGQLQVKISTGSWVEPERVIVEG